MMTRDDLIRMLQGLPADAMIMVPRGPNDYVPLAGMFQSMIEEPGPEYPPYGTAPYDLAAPRGLRTAIAVLADKDALALISSGVGLSFGVSTDRPGSFEMTAIPARRR